MFAIILLLFSSIGRGFRRRAVLHAEVLALRHQLLVLQRTNRDRRLRLSVADRLLWVWLSQLWNGWRSALVIVKPETVIAWHRRGFRLYWSWKSRHPQGRPSVAREVIDLIGRMSLANPGWGAPRIHGELLKLGFELAESTVAKYMIRPRRPASQTWRTFLTNHMQEVVSSDFFVVLSFSGLCLIKTSITKSIPARVFSIVGLIRIDLQRGRISPESGGSATGTRLPGKNQASAASLHWNYAARW
jgi:hypothetical protein